MVAASVATTEGESTANAAARLRRGLTLLQDRIVTALEAAVEYVPVAEGEEGEEGEAEGSVGGSSSNPGIDRAEGLVRKRSLFRAIYT
jgi:hypothetical protein